MKKEHYIVFFILYACHFCLNTVCSQNLVALTDLYSAEIRSLINEQMPAETIIQKAQLNQQALLTFFQQNRVDDAAYEDFFDRMDELCQLCVKENKLWQLKEWFIPFTQRSEELQYAGEARLSYWLGREYLTYDKMDSAKHFLLLAAPLMEKNQDELLWRLYGNLGLANKNQGNYDQAISYYFKSISLVKDENILAQIYNNMSTAYLQRGSLDSAEKYVQLSLDGTDMQAIRHHAYANKGRIYQYRGMIDGDLHYFELAIEQHKKALAIREKIQASDKDFFNSYLNLGANHEYLGQFALAQNAYEKALERDGNEIPSGWRLQLRQNIADVYFKKGEYSKAINSVEILTALIDKDSLGQIALTEKQLTKENLQANLALYKSGKLKVDLLITSTVLGFICIILLSLVFTERLKRLKAQQEKISMINQHANHLIEERLEAQEETFKKIGRELHDDVQNYIVAWKIDINQNSDIDAMGKLTALYDKIESLSYRLNPVSMQYSGLMPSLKELVGRFAKNGKYKLELHSTGVEGRKFAEKVQHNIYRIVQESLNNIEKYAGNPQKVVIQLIHHTENDISANGEYLSLTVEDDGCGIDMNKLIPGMGILNMKDRAEELGGSFDIDSYPGRGTIVMVKIPAEMKAWDTTSSLAT